jgi:hypothetical protein
MLERVSGSWARDMYRLLFSIGSKRSVPPNLLALNAGG